VRSRDEALEWSRRFPNPMGRGREAVVEVRQLFDMEEFTPGPDITRMRAIEAINQGSPA